MAARKAAKRDVKKVVKEQYFVLDHGCDNLLCGPYDTEAEAVAIADAEEYIGPVESGMSVSIVKLVGVYATAKPSVVKI